MGNYGASEYSNNPWESHILRLATYIISLNNKEIERKRSVGFSHPSEEQLKASLIGQGYDEGITVVLWTIEDY